MHNINNFTKYFRSTVAVANRSVIDFKNEKFWTVGQDELINGIINKTTADEIYSYLGCYKEKEKQDIAVIIIAKTIKDEFLDGEKLGKNIDELTGIYYIPANLSYEDDCILKLPKNKWPWIPREFLYPMEDEQLCIGEDKVLDKFLEDTTGTRNEIKNNNDWNEYFQYAMSLYSAVTSSDFLDSLLTYKNNTYNLSNDIYIIPDNTINSTFAILGLYDDILLKENISIPLYKKFINPIIEKTEDEVVNDSNHMIAHCGQMNGNYPLAPSQRNAVNHFNEMRDGEILAVNGPPGTGKTTLLQSIVANLYVNRALKMERPPIIVASSTNNQAVTNIIESFGKIDSIGISNLENRWIKGVYSFAAYFPSNLNKNKALAKGYQVTSQKGDGFAATIDDEANIQESKRLMIESAEAYFNQKFSCVDQCKNRIHLELVKVDALKAKLIENVSRIQHITGGNTIEKYIDINCNKISEKTYEYKNIQKEIEDLSNTIERYKIRSQEWIDRYNSISYLVRIFAFIKYFKRKIYANFNAYKTIEEFDFLSEDMLLENILECYHEKQNNIHDKIVSLREKSNNLLEDIKRIKAANERINRLKIECENIINELVIRHQCNIKIEDIKEKLNRCSLDEINNIIDVNIRYIEFWLAVHYFECRWLLGEYTITEKQRGLPFDNVIINVYQRLAFIIPCMVMTFFVLPKELRVLISNDKKFTHLYNFIDLLIVDEAGQVSPEIAAASFSLAKRAIIVGDEKQIPPVWGIQKALDIALAIENNVISNKNEFTKLITTGLNCSESSVMKIASNSCIYGHGKKDEKEKGLFLSEHRRCYDEIISYCNELVYKGKLEPMRGGGSGNNKYPFSNLPIIGHYEIAVDSSQKAGNSRRNIVEAEGIAQWIKNNYKIIFEAYNVEPSDSKKAANIIGVVTPFKAQVSTIKAQIKKCIPAEYANKISVGTVHTLQGAERNIIIFSSVYGNNDGCFFINKNTSLMNVAVSRAKDSFLVFGSQGCLDLKGSSSSALLRKYTVESVPEYVNKK